MANTHDTQTSATQHRNAPRRHPSIGPVLPEADHQQLRRHLELCEAMWRPDGTMLAHVLHNKIMTTEPVSNLQVQDLVTGGCRVTYAVDGGPGQTGLLAHRARSGAGSGVIPVSSLLGATLIGMRVGQRAPLLCDDGAILSLSVLAITPPN